MIIWGTKGLTSTVDSKQFNCPTCNCKRTGQLRQVRRFFTLYFIPIIPLNVAGRFVQCGSCGGSFAEEVLAYDPQKVLQQKNEQYLRVMVLAALSAPESLPMRLRAVQEKNLSISGWPVSDERLQAEVDLAVSANATLSLYLAAISATLSPAEQATSIRLAFEIMSVSGGLSSNDLEELNKLPATLGIPDEQFRDLIGHLADNPVAAVS
jgi:transcription elongation factor Elf1